MLAVGKTDVGNIRENNEDVLYASTDPVGSLPNLFLVADGMGGHKAGEIASRNAMRFFLDYINENQCRDGELLDHMAEAVRHANNAVYEMSLTDSNYSGMGTTFTGCVISEGKALMVHIGDSRVYLLNNGELRQITNDHTFVSEMVRAGQFSKEEAERHPGRNALTRALGVELDVSADAPMTAVAPGDTLLICSDGLSNMVAEPDIAEVLRSDHSIDVKTDALIVNAKENGGMDNITVVLVEL
ncbi:MAG: Stp1/IreP family PP2C-type Ser/Thr phosphatase [Defluviitaleaceae bacterium]|nr:Stp1/IreP family PP2C-type Ser/Thr phosphatase [Defluviitaleaceae bacterium]